MTNMLKKTVEKTQWTRTGYMMTMKTVLKEEITNNKNTIGVELTTITIGNSQKNIFFNVRNI